MPIHPKTLEAFRKKGLTMTEDSKGREVELPPMEIQMVNSIGIGQQNQNHTSWHYVLNMIKDKGESVGEHVSACKRVINKKDGKEYALVTYEISGVHYDGNPLNEHWREWGKYYLPKWQKKFNGKKNRWEEIDRVANSEEVYDIEFKGEKTKLPSPVTEKTMTLTDLIQDDTQYFIMSDRDQKLKVSRDDWFNLPRAELIKKYDTPVQQTILEDLTVALTKAQDFQARTKKA